MASIRLGEKSMRNTAFHVFSQPVKCGLPQSPQSGTEGNAEMTRLKGVQTIEEIQGTIYHGSTVSDDDVDRGHGLVGVIVAWSFRDLVRRISNAMQNGGSRFHDSCTSCDQTVSSEIIVRVRTFVD